MSEEKCEAYLDILFLAFNLRPRLNEKYFAQSRKD